MSADALKILHTGAAADGTGQADPRECLGGHRSASLTGGFNVVRVRPIRGIVIDYVAGANGTGEGALRAPTTTSLQWKAPGSSTWGAATAVAEGATVALVDGDDADAHIQVSRLAASAEGGASGLEGDETVQCLDVYNNVVGGTDWADAETTAGEVDYAALALYNAESSNITGVTVWIDSAADGPSGTATESPSSGQIQTIANRTTAPTGLSWNAATAEGSGLSVGTIAAGEWAGLWIRRTVTAGADASARKLNHVHVSYTYDGSDYHAELRGLHRTQNNGDAGYELYIGTDADPDLASAPDETFSSLPYETTTTFAAGSEYRLATLYRNSYGLAAAVHEYGVIELDGAGDEVVARPAGPDMVRIAPAADGGVSVEAGYVANRESTGRATVDERRADQWLVYHTVDGTDPDPSTDTPSVVSMSGSQYLARLSTTVAAGQLEGGPIKVLVRTRRSSDSVDSDNTTIYETTAEHWGPARPDGQLAQGRNHGLWGGAATAPSGTVEESASPSVEWEWQTDGSVTLSVAGSEVWRLYYDSSSAAFGRLSTGYAIGIGSGYGSGSEDGLEVVDASTLYVVVNGTRRMKIDVANEVLYADHWDFASAPSATRADEPVWAMWAATALQAWDASQQQYATPLSVESDGGVHSAVALEVTA